MKDFSSRSFESGAYFPRIPKGYFLKVGDAGEVQGIQAAIPRRQIFTQETLASVWEFEHDFGAMPKVIVRVYDPVTQSLVDATSSVNIEVDETSVVVTTENGVTIKGEVEIYLVGFGENDLDAVSTHVSAANPHPQYLLLEELAEEVANLGVTSTPNYHEVVTATSKIVELNKIYIVEASSNVVFQLPASGFPTAPQVGDFIDIIGSDDSGWSFDLRNGHTLYMNGNSISGAGESLSSVENYAIACIKCIKSETNNIVWRVTNSMANLSLGSII